MSIHKLETAAALRQFKYRSCSPVASSPTLKRALLNAAGGAALLICDQSAAWTNATVTSNTGTISAASNGATGAGVAYGVHASNTAIHTGRIAITRSAALEDAEVGSGKASLKSYGLAGEIGWGLALDDGTVMTPYVGLRHTLARRGAYGERAVEGVVDFPIAYAAFSQSLTTATAGLRLKGQVTDQIGFQFGLGAEYDLIQKAGSYSGASAIPGLETFALPGAETANRFRPVGNAGLFYQIDGTQRLTGSVTARGQAFSNQPAVAVLAGYQAAF